jgi:hypothetical protein
VRRPRGLVGRTLSGVDRGSLVERARHHPAIAEYWPGERAWTEVVDHAAKEEPGFTPLSSVLWEVLWRLDPHLVPPDLRLKGPPEEPGAPWWLNPFLLEPTSSVHIDTVASLHEFDAEAADLYASAVRAERLAEWPSPSALVAGAVEAHEKQRVDERELMSMNGVDAPRPADFGAKPGWVPNMLEDLGSADALDDYELALTRLMLVGHGTTTRRLLPAVLVLGPPSGPDTFLTEVDVFRTALRRLEPRERPGVASAALSAIVRGRPADPALAHELRNVARGAGRIGRASRLTLAMSMALAPSRTRRVRTTLAR